jgi:hypothetical protein
VSNHLLTSNETAKLLRTSRGVLANWRWAGTGPAYIKMSRILYEVKELEQWISKHKVKTSDI